MKEQFKGKRFKQGSYSSVLIVIVIAIVVVINMVASQLPAQYAKLGSHHIYYHNNGNNDDNEDAAIRALLKPFSFKLFLHLIATSLAPTTFFHCLNR